jgi:hypothetical protein
MAIRCKSRFGPVGTVVIMVLAVLLPIYLWTSQNGIIGRTRLMDGWFDGWIQKYSYATANHLPFLPLLTLAIGTMPFAVSLSTKSEKIGPISCVIIKL